MVRVIQKGNILFESSRGYASIEFGIRNDMATRFSVASVTKQFTAFAVMILHDRGLLELDEKENGYLPACMQLSSDITVHQLLCHTSGLHNNYNFEDDLYVGADRMPYDREAFFHDWIVKQPTGKPGDAFEYNNSNYNLLAWIIEEATGQPFHEFLGEHILSRLGMTSTSFDNGQEILRNKANNYMHDYGVLVRVPYTNPLFGTGAGEMITNCDDLQKWYECLKNRKILSGKAYERFLRENKNHYCYGLECHDTNGIIKYAHGGDFLGVSAYTQYFFEEDICILIMSNTESLNQYRFGNDIAAILHGGQAQSSRREEEIPLQPEELRKYAGTYLPGKICLTSKLPSKALWSALLASGQKLRQRKGGAVHRRIWRHRRGRRNDVPEGGGFSIVGYGVLAIDDAVDQEKLSAAVRTIGVKGKVICARSIKDHYGLKQSPAPVPFPIPSFFRR